MVDCLVYVPYKVGEHDFGSQREAMFDDGMFLAWDYATEYYSIELPNVSHYMRLPESPSE